MAGALLGGSAAGAASGIASSLIGGKKKTPRPVSFESNTGLNAKYIGPKTGYRLTESAPLQNNLFGLSQSFADNASSLRGLLGQVEPGTGLMTKAGSLAFDNARQKLADRQRAAVGNLRDNLARRRVLGSSFASDAVSRQNATYEQTLNDLAAQEAGFKADTYQKELAQKIDLTNQISANVGQQFKAFLDQANLEAGISANLATGGNSVINTGASLLTDLYKSAQQGAGAALEPYIRQIGDTVQNYVNTPAPTPTTVFT